jgi:pimeloyl-ACP methyl ester carboxylesterase
LTAFPKPVSALSKPQARGETVVHDRRITVDRVETQYLEAGAGPPLLLLHGHEQGTTSWRWVIPALARTHRVLALSLPGHGESGPAGDGHAPGADLAPFVAAFLLAVGAELPLDLVGHSAGGAIALRLTLADPARIRTLTLVDNAGLGREVHPLLALDTLPVVGELAVMISRMPGGDLARTTMSAALLFAQPWRIPAEFVAEQHALARRPGQLEASTATARALFGPHGQRQILLDRSPRPHHADPGRVGRPRLPAARPAGPRRSEEPAPRPVVGIPRLRAPAPRRTPRPLRRRARRLARRTPRPPAQHPVRSAVFVDGPEGPTLTTSHSMPSNEAIINRTGSD